MNASTPPPLVFDEIDDLLYFTRANETQELQQCLHELAQKHQCQSKAVLEAAIDPETGNTVLHFCSANGLTDLLALLLAQLNGEDRMDVVEDGVLVSPLVNHGNKEGNTPLHWAAYNGHLDVVKTLLAAGADMWVKNAAGHLPMFEAERADKNDVVQHLLEAGGKEVEKAGVEGLPSADDIAEVQDDEVDEAGSSAQANGGVEVDMDRPSND